MQYEEILKTEYGIAFDQTPTLDAEHLLPIYDFEETQYHDLTIMAQDYEICGFWINSLMMDRTSEPGPFFAS